MKVFSRIAYHSTNQKGLVKFKNTTSSNNAYKGEGYQIHGWGLYLQADKSLNAERYRDRLYGESRVMNIDCTITIGRKEYYTRGWFNGWFDSKLNDVDKKTYESLDLIRKYGSVNDALVKLQSGEDNTYSWEYSNYVKENVIKLLEKWSQVSNVTVDETKREIRVGGGTQYSVEIPDDFVFIDEDRLLDANNSKIKSLIDEFDVNLPFTQEEFDNSKNVLIKSLVDAWRNYPEYDETFWRECVDYWQMITSSGSRDMDYASYQFSRKYRGFNRTFEDILNSQFGYYCAMIRYNGSGKTLYERISKKSGSEKKASEYLYERGINGMRYVGELDGLCWVVFNCKDLRIIGEN